MSSAPPPPAKLGRYELVRRIGAGGMGEVFLAREPVGRSGTEFRARVVKTILPTLKGDRHVAARFRDEARAGVFLQHPNVARVFAVGEEDGQVFLAMEYVRGKTLSRLLRRLRDRKRPFPAALALWVAERICDGLAYAHSAPDDDGKPLKLVHRDISPANVCVSYRGEVKIIDFGAALSAVKEEQTATGKVIGSLPYMAPEQALGQPVDARADVYSTGATLWELLTGISPTPGEELAVRWRRAAKPDWAAPSKHRPDLPPEVDALVLRALQPKASDRFATASRFAAELAGARRVLRWEATQAELGRLLTSVYGVEAEAEEAALRELLQPGRARVGSQEDETVLAPPTASAFEHAEVEPPILREPAREKAPREPIPVLVSSLELEVSLSDSNATLVRPYVPPPHALSTRRAVFHSAWLSYGAVFVGALLLGMALTYLVLTRG